MLPPTTLVIPCYNEAERLDDQAILQALARFPTLQIVLVNDGSGDRTGELLADIGLQSGDRAKVVSLPSNSGKAEAVRQGLLAALEAGPEWVGYWDADLSAPLEALADFAVIMSSRAEVDIVMGSRVKLLGRDIRRELYRHYIGRVFATAASVALGVPVYDTQCGAKMFRVTERTRALISMRFDSRWIFDVELLDRYLASAGRDRRLQAEHGIYELALRSWHYKRGSKLRLSDAARAAVDLWRIYRRRA